MSNMKRRQFLGSGIAAGAGVATAAFAATSQGAEAVSYLRAGVAKSDITTDAKGVRINDPLYAKALVLDDGRTKLAIVAMDATAIGGIGDIKDDFLPKLRARIEKELGIAGRNVLVSATHTHPPGRLLCDDKQQVERTFDAVRQAAGSMVPVKVGVGAGHEDRIMMNRTLRLKDGSHWSIRHGNPCPPDEDVVGVGPIDPEIGVLRIDRMNGRPLAVVFNFASHPYITVPRGGITADYPGFASKVIEDNLSDGKSGEGCMAVFLQGAGGDITSILYKDVNRPRDSEPLGVMLGLSTLDAWRKIETADAKLSVINETIELPRKFDMPQLIEKLEGEQARLLSSLRGTSLNLKTFLPLYIKQALDPQHPSYYSYRYLQAEKTGSNEMSGIDAQNRGHLKKYLRNIRAMEKMARNQDRIATLRRHLATNEKAGRPTLSTEVQGVKIGDCVFITSATEMLVEVGLNIKKVSPHKHTFIAAYANGYIQYGPPAADYDKGGYEVTECLLAPEWQAIYEKKAGEIIRRL
ncbi:MAG: hypothetical protein JXM70_14585 [Pirellulales bacterium]|nr:hypothetical protein [Pirellulales bacterium]